MNIFSKATRRFLHDRRGSLAIEAVLFIPLLVWVLLATTTIWEGYRAKSLAQRATFVIADVISRERAQLNATQNFRNYLRVFGYVAEAGALPTSPSSAQLNAFPAALRITNVIYSVGENGTGSVNVLWSIATHSARMAPLTNDTIGTVSSKIPALLDGDSIVLVESELKWTPRITAAMAADSLIGGAKDDFADTNTQLFGEQTFKTFVTVRPRFVSRLCILYITGGVATNVPCEL